MIPLAALVVVAASADGEGTFVAGNEELAIGGEADIVPANLANLAACLLQRLRLLAQAHRKT